MTYATNHYRPRSAQATGIKSTPTVRINGQDYEFSTPAALAEKAKEIAPR